MAKFNENNLYHQPKYLQELVNIAHDNIPDNEIIFIALKGTFKEYLFCTDNNIYIIKKGFMTGHLFGDGNFKMPYRNITNVEVNYGFGGGYFEVSAGGIQNTDKNYWSTDKKQDPAKQPNTISITGSQLKEAFSYASSKILDRINNQHHSQQIAQQQTSSAEEIMKFKQLLDDGIITQEEFEMKKKQLLNI